MLRRGELSTNSGWSLHAPNTIDTAVVGAQHLGYDHAAVGLLVVFEHGDQGARQSERGAVEGMDEFGLGALARAKAHIVAASLKIGTVRAGADFQPFARARRPQ